MREMRIEDYDEVYALWLQTECMGLNSKDESRQGIKRFIERNPHSNFVEEKDRKIVGVIMAGHDGRRGTLHHLAVDKEYRHQGIGKALVEAAVEAMRKEGIIRVNLFVYEDNDEGKYFWNTQGFTVREDLDYMDRDLEEVVSINSERKC